METKSSIVTSWKAFCKLVVKLFYRKFEVTGINHLPNDRGIVLCANHVNALADPVIAQAATDKLVRPLARSGLFQQPLLGWWLRQLGAVPIYRPGDKGSNASQNKDSFARCYELLYEAQTLIIFPEGQSHSDSHLHRLKSGAARLTLGALEANGIAPAVIPVGLNFSRKGHFRGDILVNFGAPVDFDLPEGLTPRQTVREINNRITLGLKAVTINADSWQDVDLVQRLERFFAHRQGKIRKRNLSQRFSAFQRLLDAQQLLRKHEPKKLNAVIHKLRAYERLCKRFGVKDYHLTLQYQSSFVILQSMRILLLLTIGLPLTLFGLLNSGTPYLLTRVLVKKLAKSKDQYDTSKIIIGGGLFLLFWGAQIAVMYYWFGLNWSLIYLISLIISATVALRMRGQTQFIKEDIKVFFLLVRKKKVKQFLIEKRQEIETKLAQLIKVARHLSGQR